MITTTLNRIREYHPCESGWVKLLRGLGKTGANDACLPYATILRVNGLDDALWCCRVEPKYDKEWRLFAVWCARQVEYRLTDAPIINAINVAERFAHGNATAQDLDAANLAACIAANIPIPEETPDDAWYATRAALSTTVNGEPFAAAKAAARGAACAATAANSEIAREEVRQAARAAQASEFLRVVGGEKA